MSWTLFTELFFLGVLLHVIFFMKGFFSLEKAPSPSAPILLLWIPLLFPLVRDFLSFSLFNPILPTLQTSLGQFFPDPISFRFFLTTIEQFFFFLLLLLFIPKQLTSYWVAKPWGIECIIGFCMFPLVFSTLFPFENASLAITDYFSLKAPIRQSIAGFANAARGSSIGIIFSTLSIGIFTPIIEETVFRGICISSLRSLFSSKNAIVFSSILFSLHHYETQLGIYNIPTLLTVFFFALYLGFLYEKRRNLIPSIVLHSCFNIVSLWMI